MIEQFRNLKSDVPSNKELALRLNEVICALNGEESAQLSHNSLTSNMPMPNSRRGYYAFGWPSSRNNNF